MKMKNLLLSLSLAGACVNNAVAQVPHPMNPEVPSARHIGDGVRSIGDTNRYVPQSDDVRPAEFVPAESSMGGVSPAAAMDLRILAPTSSNSSARHGLVSSGNSGGPWLNGEFLLWFSDAQASPPVATSAGNTVNPIAGNPGVTNQLGGPDIERGVLPGFRFSAGTYFGDEERVGIGGRAYGILQNSEKYSAVSDGSTSLGIPFFNVQTNANDAFLVAFDNGVQLVSDGSLEARSDLDMIGAEGSLHLLINRSARHRSDLLVGYTYNRLKNSIGVASVSTNRAIGDGIPDGTVFTTNDLFESENTFHGGHLGVLSTMTASRISLSSLVKVSFGNMNRQSNVAGYLVEEFGGSSTTTAGGVLTQASNIGTTSTDSFAFIPEMGLKLGYAVNDNIQLSLGYSFMFWSTVGMAGQQIDSSVDLTQASPRPETRIADSTFWMQGIDFGVVLTR